MKNLIYILSIVLATALSASANLTGDWKSHPTFDNSVTAVVPTPQRIYFTGNMQTLTPSITYKATPEAALFYYDPEGDEIVGMTHRNGLSSVAVNKIAYNPWHNYLIVIYNDLDIDLIFDNGEVTNIAALKTAQIPGSKSVNDIFFYPKGNLAYLATDFGYVAIDDQKGEVAESRTYPETVNSIGRLGNWLYLAAQSGLYVGKASDPRLNLTDYTKPEDLQPLTRFFSMGEDDARLLTISPSQNYATTSWKAGANGALVQIARRSPGSCHSVVTTKTGYIIVPNGDNMTEVSYAGYFSNRKRPADEVKGFTTSWDMQTFYTVQPRKGIRAEKASSDVSSQNWTVIKDFSLPNAPNAYYSRGMAYHPRYGMLVNSHGVDAIFSNTSQTEPILLSGYLGGNWTPLSPSYRNSAYAKAGQNPNGITIDINDDKYVYMGSFGCGITRLNLDDPNDILMMSHPADALSSKPGYVEFGPDFSWKRFFNVSTPIFDSNGVLWSFACNWNQKRAEYKYWLPADRQASKDAASFRPWKTIPLDGISYNTTDIILPLTAQVNRGIIVNATDGNGHTIVVYDHNNTLDNKADDKYVEMNSSTDQDGGVADTYHVNTLFEDQDSGTVWIGCHSGIFHFQPRTALAGQNVLNRVKVSRNDGTSLADYLLNGITVNHITADASNRKWISTNGAGLVVTSADGRNIIDEFTEVNSFLPSDVVYFSQYNPDTRSMVISTDKGIAEFFIAGSADGEQQEDEVRAYPNPVAPDYYGWVTIDGLPDNCLVKVVDAQGNLVRELGRAESGSVQWDVLNLYGKRVNTGVYYIFASSISGSESSVCKILVMN